MGLITSASVNKPEQWSAIKKFLVKGKEDIMNDCKLAVAPKLDHAIVFIKWLADMFAEPGYIDCGCTSDAGNRPEVLIEVSSIGNTSQIKFLPYDHSIEVFNEYENFYHVQESNLHPSEKETCGISTFRDALW